MSGSLTRKLGILLVIVFGLSACAQSLTDYEEFAPFNRSATASKMLRLPVIIVPGIKGSLLKKGDKEIWGKSYRVALLHKFDDLQLNLAPQLQENFQDKFKQYYDRVGIRSGGIMEAYRIGFRKFTFFKVPIYDEMKTILNEIGGYRDDKELFTFSYDWRLDNRIAAVQLSLTVDNAQAKYRRFLKETLGDGFDCYWAELRAAGLLTSENKVRVNLVAHSMGGLVSRYYLQMLGGGEQVNKLIMLGTPNLGAMDSLKALAKGEYPESAIHFYFEESTRPVIFSWPSTFQLLPRYPTALRRLDGAPVPNQDWGLDDANIDIEQVVTRWDNYHLIPAAIPDRKLARLYLKEQLENAYYFHRAINGRPDIPYEEKKLEQIQAFTGSKFQPKPLSSEADTPVIIFGGHCAPTLKYAFLGKKETRKYIFFGKLESRPCLLFKHPGEEETSLNKSATLGDGRVPTISLTYPRTEDNCTFDFLICEDHVGLVKNTTFQYNLLRELLGQTTRINK